MTEEEVVVTLDAVYVYARRDGIGPHAPAYYVPAWHGVASTSTDRRECEHAHRTREAAVKCAEKIGRRGLHS